VGGTGKTPMVIYLATLLKQTNVSHVIVSRGYKKKGSGTLIVNDGKRILADSAKECGDEPLLLAHKLPSTPIVVGNNKIKAINVAIQTFEPKIIILDDAFQSYYLDKNIDIVLFNCLHSKNNFHLLPTGLLRSPISSLVQSNLVIFTKRNLLKTKQLLAPTKKILHLLKNNNIPYLFSDYRSNYKEYDLFTKQMKSLNCIEKNQASVLAFSGIGDSDSFNILCNNFFHNIIVKKSFADHYHYNNFEHHIKDLYNTHKFSAIVTTYKDFIKLSTDGSKTLSWMKNQNIRFFIIEIEMYIEDEHSQINQLIKNLTL